MATDSGLFANTAFQGSIAPSVAVQNPVSNNGAADLINSIDNGVQQAGEFFKAGAKASADAANSAVLVKYQNDITGIADGVEQNMSVQEARMRVRAITSQYIANYPGMVKDIDDLQGKLMSDHGLAGIINTGNEAYQQNKAVQDEAFKAGWPDVASYRAAQTAANNAKVIGDELAAKQSQYGLLTVGDKLKGYGAVKNFVQAAGPWVDNTFDKYQTAINNGTMTAPAAIAALNADIGKETSVFGGVVSQSGGAEKDIDTTIFTKGITDRQQAFAEYNSGKLTADQYKNQVDTINSMNELALDQTDPVLAKMAALSKLLPPIAGTGFMDKLNSKALDYITSLEQAPGVASTTSTGQQVAPPKPKDLISSDPDMTNALGAAAQSIKAMGPSPTPDQQTAINNTMTNVLASVKTFGGSAGDAKDFNSVINFLGDPAVNAAVVKAGGIPKGAGNDAAYVIQQQYGEVLLPLVKTEWDNAIAKVTNTSTSKGPMSSDVENANVAGVVVPVWNGASVEFQPAPGFDKDARVVAIAKGLNTSIAPPLNNYIRAASTVQGTNDYQSYYNANIKDRLFTPTSAAPVNPDAPKPTADKVSDLAAGFINKATPDGAVPSSADASIKGFEGFSPTAYWDVNHYRVGFGSSTYTDASGVVHNVTANTTVSRDDAQRDLTRRSSTEFIPGIIDKVGQDTWDKLSDGTKAALTSVAYNYGSLNNEIVSAVKSGDKNLIADTIAVLKANPQRRQAEAQMVRNG